MANDPAYGEPRRTIRISDELWEAALATADSRHESAPELVRLALAAYAASPEAVLRYLTRTAQRKEKP